MKFALLAALASSFNSTVTESNGAVFGSHFQSAFMLKPGFHNFNHGSFGATPRDVIDAQRRLIDQAESEPDAWFRNDARCNEKSVSHDADTLCYGRRLDSVRTALAKYIGADKTRGGASSVVFLENASAGVNAVLRSMDLQPGDRVLILSTAYPVTPNTLKYLNGWSKGMVDYTSVKITFPVKGVEDFLRPVQKALDEAAREGRPYRMAIFSHIASTPAVIVPVEELATACQAAGVPVLVDGAHALGNIHIDMAALEASGVTYYTANGHKWLYSPKGSAFLWASMTKGAQETVAPTVISSEAGGPFDSQFLYTGTRDYTPFVAIGDALAWREKHGGDSAIVGYVTGLSHWAQRYLSRRWQSGTIAPESMTSAMANVRLPVAAQSAEVAQELAARLLENYNTYIVVYEADGVWYTRLSAQLYLGRRDFVRMADVVDEILGDDLQSVQKSFSI